MEIPIPSSISNILFTVVIELFLIDAVGSLLLDRAGNALLCRNLERTGSTNIKRYGQNARMYRTVIRVTMLLLFIVLELGIDGVSKPKKEYKNLLVQNRKYNEGNECMRWDKDATVCFFDEKYEYNVSMGDLDKGTLEMDEEAIKNCLTRIISSEEIEVYSIKAIPDYRSGFANNLYCTEDIVDVFVKQYESSENWPHEQEDLFFELYPIGFDLNEKEIKKLKERIYNVATAISPTGTKIDYGSWDCITWEEFEVDENLRRKLHFRSMRKESRKRLKRPTVQMHVKDLEWEHFDCFDTYVTMKSDTVEARMTAIDENQFMFSVKFTSKWLQFPLSSFLDMKAVHTWWRSETKSKELLIWYIHARPWNNESFPISNLDDLLFIGTPTQNISRTVKEVLVTNLDTKIVFGSAAVILTILIIVTITGYVKTSSLQFKPLDIDWWASAWAGERVRDGRNNNSQNGNDLKLTELNENTVKITTLSMEI